MLRSRSKASSRPLFIFCLAFQHSTWWANSLQKPRKLNYCLTSHDAVVAGYFKVNLLFRLIIYLLSQLHEYLNGCLQRNQHWYGQQSVWIITAFLVHWSYAICAVDVIGVKFKLTGNAQSANRDVFFLSSEFVWLYIISWFIGDIDIQMVV